MTLKEIVRYKRSLTIKTIKDLPPANRSLLDSLKKGSCFILEIKFASPSKGLIKEVTGEDEAANIANIYAPFAGAISVLADKKFFAGSSKNVAKVSKDTSLPILYKDVVVSKSQVLDARAHGAHAILLMLSVLSDEEYLSYAKCAHTLNMDVICEVHNELEMKRAVALKAKIIGINNRNLNTLEIDLNTSNHLLKLAPKDVFIILESGFYHRRELLQFKNRAHGFLIGTSIMKAKRMDLALRELLFGRVKICGITTNEDACSAYAHGAYYGGLNFASCSKRVVSLSKAKIIKHDVPLKWGGVFVDQPIDEIVNITKELKLDFVQLHGHESDNFIMKLKENLPQDCEIWKALKVKDKGLDTLMYSPAHRILLDTFSKDMQGGTGQSFDWNILNSIKDKDKFILAGGITPSNAYEASLFALHAIDMASGVESEPRKKSKHLLKELFDNLKV